MDLIVNFIDVILHIDVYLDAIIRSYGVWAYLILFIIIFCETGLVVTPFLPGDSLLFAAGAITALGSFDFLTLFIVISVAAITGDTVNYWAGRYAGPKVFARFLNKKHLERTHEFYEKYGGITIILARFVPIIRTFAPFVAGIGKMTYWHFISYNIIGGLLWPALFITTGYFFGNMPVVKKYFSLVIIAIIIISVIPIMIEIIKVWREKRK
jgi:membrane-associated protein